MPRTRALSSVPPSSQALTVREAVSGDIPAMAALQDGAQLGRDLRMPHSALCWRALVAREGSTQLGVGQGEETVATGRLAWLGAGEAVLGEVAAPHSVGAQALLAYSAERVGIERLSVSERPGSVGGDAIEEFLAPAGTDLSCYYTRVPDVAALLERLRPVLSARLTAAGLGDGRGETIVSFFREHVRLPYENGEFGVVIRGGRMQSPGAAGGAGVAPDMVTSLLFGPYGIEGLAQRHPDVYPGPQRTLMTALFPPVRADLLTFYVP
jgi:hypothetical protein